MKIGYSMKLALLLFIFPHLSFCMHYSDMPGDIVTDDISGQRGIVCEVETINATGTCREKQFALLPLSGQKIPCPIDLLKRIAPKINREDAQRSCQAYCSNSPLNEFFMQLKQGALVRTVLHGETGVGKNYLAYSFPQEADYPYVIMNVPIVFLFTKWHNCMYEGMKNVLSQAMQHSHESGKKVVLILDNIEHLECSLGECHGKPQLRGSIALNEFFDSQDQGDPTAKNISIIAITSVPQKISNSLLARFFQNIQIGLPTTEQRYAIILSCISQRQDKIDESVIRNSRKLAEMTATLTARNFEHLFCWADQERYNDLECHDMFNKNLSKVKSKITWEMVQKACAKALPNKSYLQGGCFQQ